MSNAVAGLGTSLKLGDGASVETFAEIAEVASIGMSGMTREEIEVTHLGSLNGFREYLLSFKDVGEINVMLNYTEAAWDDFFSLWDDGTINNFQIVFPDSTRTFEFAAYVRDMPFEDIVPDDKIAFNVTLRVSGGLTITS